MNKKEVIQRLNSLSNPKNLAGMARFGINIKNTLGIPIPELRKLAKEIGKDNDLACQIYDSGIHEARILACYIGQPELVNKKQIENWVKQLDSWDDCDQCCSAFFDKTKGAHKLAMQWAKRKEEFVKRAGFSLMAVLAVHDKKAKDQDFLKFFPYIKKESKDERNFVKKAVNWALRQIGKRNSSLRKEAVKLAKEILEIDSSAAKWIARNALAELEQKN